MYAEHNVYDYTRDQLALVADLGAAFYSAIK